MDTNNYVRSSSAIPILKLDDFLPPNVLTKSGLARLDEAIRKVHFPKNLKEAEEGRERLAFNELLNLELTSLYRKINWKRNKVANKIKVDKPEIDKFISSLPFKLTASQTLAVKEILEDLS